MFREDDGFREIDEIKCAFLFVILGMDTVFSLPDNRSLIQGVVKTSIVLVVLLSAVFTFKSRYLLLIDGQNGPSCLPFRYFLVDTKNHVINRGDLVAFKDQDMSPFFPAGLKVVKRVAGIPGDRISIEGDYLGRTFVNNKIAPVKLDLLAFFPNVSPSDYSMDFVLPDNRYFMLGDLAMSYDSRYWGPIRDTQVLGKVYALF